MIPLLRWFGIWCAIAVLLTYFVGVTCTTVHRGKIDLMYCRVGNSFEQTLSKIPQEEQEDDDFGAPETEKPVRSYPHIRSGP